MPHSAISAVAWSRTFNQMGVRLGTTMSVTSTAGSEHFVVPRDFAVTVSEFASRAEVPPLR